MENQLEKFWSKVNRGSPSECWNWSGAKKPRGYGNVRINKKYLIAHRVAWEISYGPIPKGMLVLHSCDNPSCCNPGHLMLGSIMSNHIDMTQKGRSKCNHKNRKLGEEHPQAKLTVDQVQEIKERYIRGAIRQKDLAEEFGVSQPAISAIILNKVRVYG